VWLKDLKKDSGLVRRGAPTPGWVGHPLVSAAGWLEASAWGSCSRVSRVGRTRVRVRPLQWSLGGQRAGRERPLPAPPWCDPVLLAGVLLLKEWSAELQQAATPFAFHS